MPDLACLLRAGLVWLLIAIAEVLQGMARIKFLNRRIGDHRARQVGVGTGCALIFAIAWFSHPWIGATSSSHLLVVGLIWVALMLAFDVGFGRMVFRVGWSRIAADFDPRRGGLLGFGMLFLAVAPLLVAHLKRIP